ncbi:MAG: helix-turn-helix transcriptional regulator [Bacteroidetes bacterium]|nr:helix-turn-helix transcriptional regulator [Bacteroidota bacterium]
MVHLGNNIAKLRNFRRIPQKEVASRLNISQSEYSRLESKAEISDDLLEHIADVINYPVDLIKELDNSSIQSVHNSGSISDSIFYQNNPNEKIQDLYERLLKEKDDIIKSKDEVIEMYRKQQKAS